MTESIFEQLTPAQIDLLISVGSADVERPSTPAIVARYETRRGESSHGTIRGHLNDLEARGLLVKGRIDGRTNNYRLSADGKRALASLRDDVNAALEDDE